MKWLFPLLLVTSWTPIDPPRAADVAGATEHPLVSRYPGQELRWQTIDNFREFRIPTGPVTGYRNIDDWIDMALVQVGCLLMVASRAKINLPLFVISVFAAALRKLEIS